ncbi:hypothetical protein PN836_001985 [Ningiella sp. W23]|uniref:hypothetical protein n=1 Tax=Ningiella sp. W23 TaxID=3023715 RepID=UPI003757FD3C
MAPSSNDSDFAPINVDASDRIPVGAKKSQAKKAPSSGSGGGGSGKGLVIISLLIALIATAGCAYLYTELQKSQETIIANQNRLQSLENRLSATGEEMGNSTVALQVKVSELSDKTEELWDQMDKLWASAWRRNQEQIKELNSKVVTVQSSVSDDVSEITQKVNAAQSANQQLISRIDSLNSKLTEQANNLLAVQVEYEGFGETSNAQAQTMRALEEKILLLEKRNTTLLQKLNELEGQVEELTVKTI